MSAYLTFDMLGSTSWTTYSHADKMGEIGEVTYDYNTEMEIGLQEATLLYYYEECDEDERCFDFEIDEEFDILVSPLTDHTIDCKDTENAEEDDMCEVDSAGSTTHSIITGGLGILALTLVLACISVVGYVPGWIVRLLSSISGITIFIAPIVWFVMLPDLNSGLEPDEQKWRLAHAFYLTLLSGPVIFFGGLVFGSMEAFAFDKYEDWDDDDYDDEDYDDDDYDEEYSQISTSMSRKDSFRPERQEQVDVNWQGVWGDDGYEWIEHPEGSEIWYWRDQDTGQWVRH